MPHFTPQQLQTWTGGKWLDGRLPAAPVCGFTQDSRNLKPAMCFVALKTAVRDGHTFISAAFAAGAAMALVEKGDTGCALPQLVVGDSLRAFQQIARAHRLAFGGKVVGVTGSCGKTSTKNILQVLLGQGCHATHGNLNNFIGVPLTLLDLEPATHTTAVIEAGISERGEMAALAAMIRPDIAIVTMIGAAHLQDLGSVEGVAAEKVKLAGAVDAVGAGEESADFTDKGVVPQSTTPKLPLIFAPLECWRYPAFTTLANQGVAVAPAPADREDDSFKAVFPAGDWGNEHDDLRRQVREAAEAEDAQTDAEEPELPARIALYRYAIERLDEAEDGSAVFLLIEGEQLCGRFALGFSPSSGMASNLALALVAAHTLGVSADLLAQRVRSWKPQGDRGSWMQAGVQRFFVDCYNANPSSMHDSLAHFVASLAAGGDEAPALPRLYVIGGMRELGAESALWHQRLGLFLGTVLDVVRGDTVAVIGEAENNAALAAAVGVTAPQARVHTFAQTQEAQALVSGFSGTVFLKGSRFYALEKLLPPSCAIAQFH